MELLFVILAGLIMGGVARYLFPLRDTHGVVLLPAVGAITSAVIWEILTWLGWAWSDGWIWVVTLVVTALVVGITAPVLGRVRRDHDRAQLTALLSRKARA
ncbi:hypothetical protein [Subtercola endophyticus]|uniref:hypothetical protein n=1 Tax=Subtercola endophyticus TaxID=2895559 RepID=UPI001E409CEB|nr:hypothetical protein [Subtercola endophyticus]UFS59921.1 hypothetical protein LQ955_03795 [Subtercola endophyticus]